MANTHITAARECDQFKGNTRLLLFILADAAYDDKPRPKGLAPGWLYLDEVELQARMNTPRLSTVRECLKELVEAGAIQRNRRFHNTTLTYVDLDWLKAHARPHSTENVRCGTDMAQTSDQVSQIPVVAPRVLPECSQGATQVQPHGKREVCSTENVRSVLTENVLPRTENVVRSTSSVPLLEPPVVPREMMTSEIAPQVLPQAEAKPAPKTFDTEDDGLSFKEETPVPKSTAVPVIGLNGLKIPTCTYQNPCSDPNCTNQDCWLRRKADERHARKVVNKPIPTTPTKHCSCPNNSPFCVVCYSKQSVEDEIGAIS